MLAARIRSCPDTPGEQGCVLPLTGAPDMPGIVTRCRRCTRLHVACDGRWRAVRWWHRQWWQYRRSAQAANDGRPGVTP